jgi:hypothetical protein
MSKDIILVLSGISGFLSLVSTIAYIYFYYASARAATAEKSLVEIVQGEKTFTATDIINTLSVLDAKDRPAALKVFLQHETKNNEKANRIYDKIESNIDINAITKEYGRQRRYTAQIGAIVFLALAALGFLYAIWPPPPPPAKLSIERVRSFDPSKKLGSPGDWSVSELRPENVISAKNADDFLLPLGFVVRNFVRREDGTLDLNYNIIGLRDNGQSAWETDRDLSHVNDWKNIGAAKSVGGEKALAAMDNPEAPGEKTLPLIPYLECAKPDQLQLWSGKLEIVVVDRLAGNERARARYSVQFQKDKLDLAVSGSCK